MRVWTKKEEAYLRKNVGIKTVYVMAKKLGRGTDSVKQKIRLMELGSFRDNTEYLTCNMLGEILGVHANTVYKTYCCNNGLKYKEMKQSKKKVVRLIAIDDFWKWADTHRELIHADRMEENILGIEPDWLKEKRKADSKNPYKHYWSESKKASFLRDVKSNKYTSEQIQSKYGITYKNMHKRLTKLNVPDRPMGEKKGRWSWNDEQEQLLDELVKSGMKQKEIIQRMNRTRDSIQSRLRREWGTSDLRKIRRANGWEE